MRNMILDLCGGTGSWSNPWKTAGYDVRVVTLPEFNVLEVAEYHEFLRLTPANRVLEPRDDVPWSSIVGILAAPPCTECTKCGQEHRQLAEWLVELRERRKEGLVDDAVGNY
jgi:hypothetical protein